jgi:hypothetical protein
MLQKGWIWAERNVCSNIWHSFYVQVFQHMNGVRFSYHSFSLYITLHFSIWAQSVLAYLISIRKGKIGNMSHLQFHRQQYLDTNLNCTHTHGRTKRRV